MSVALHVDVYPSRVADEPSMLERLDPVVYPPLSRDRNVLSVDDLDRFNRDGYLVLDDVFSEDEVAAMSDELAALERDPQVRADERTILEPGDDTTVRSIFEIHRVSRLFDRVLTDERLVAPARRLLGDEVSIHQSRVNCKPALYGKEFFWHSDFETWHVEDGMPRMRALSASIALTENTEFNGPLMVIPGSHRWYVTCVGTTPDRHYEQSLRRQEYGVPDLDSLRTLVERGGIEAPKPKAGSVVIFDANMMHASGVNLSPHPRSNVFVVYNAMSNALVDPFGVETPRPSHIADRNPVPLG